MKDGLRDLEADLRAQRLMKGRPSDLERMAPEQLASERADLHQALLRFEESFGQPETAEEKEITRYDSLEKIDFVEYYLRNAFFSPTQGPLRPLQDRQEAREEIQRRECRQRHISEMDKF